MCHGLENQCTNCDEAKKITDCAKLETPPPLCLNTATITIPYLIPYLTQLTTYPTPPLSQIPTVLSSSLSPLIQNLMSVYTSCLHFLSNSHRLKLIVYFYINIITTVTCAYNIHEDVIINMAVSNPYLLYYLR
jgi:hypothetical protein